jgi:taurine transport system substrate-binding protein
MTTTVADPTSTPPPGPPRGATDFQKRRRRRWIAIALAVVVVIALVAVVADRGGSSSSSAGKPSFTVAYGQGNVANADSIIHSQPSLAATVPARLHYVPFDAGVTAIAELRSGSLQAISGVGNPPVVGAIGNGTDVVVVIAQSFDADALIVPADIASPAQLAGKSVGVLVGSSEDFELRGWLALQHLTSSVKVVGLSSEQAVAAAYLAGTLQGAYVQAGPEAQLTAKGGHALTDAEKIAKLGIPGLNVVAVSGATIKAHPALVQQYVCAEVQATKDFTGPDADKYLAQSAGVQGVPANLIVSATTDYPFIPLTQQLHWLGSSSHDTGSQIVKAYAQTAQFLVGQGRISSVPSNAELAAHVDSTFVRKALDGACSS